MVPWIQKLHQQYGEVVRLAPSECSFISAETAWQDIYGFHTGKNKSENYQKSPYWYPVPYSGSPSMLVADDAGHSRMRKNLSHAFSDRALREQEPLIQELIDLLIQRLNERAEQGNEETDIMSWFNFATFDIIADLTFGEPLNCLRDRGYHPWVKMMLGTFKAGGLMAIRRTYPLVAFSDYLVSLVKDNSSAALKARIDFAKGVTQSVHERLDKKTDRADFFSAVIKNQGMGDKALTPPEMVSNALLLLIAGSETTATLLSGVTFLLLQNPDVYKKITHEIRERFDSADQITFAAVEKLEYTIAVLQETLRYYPPVPTGFPRVAPPGGGKVSGYYIPGDTTVYVSQHATNHSTRNFVEPDSFIPERWLKDAPAKFKDVRIQTVAAWELY